MKRWFILLPLLLIAASEPIVIDTKSHAVKPSSPSTSAPADFDFTGRTVIGLAGGGGGGGTVTSFSAGNLAPIFTTTVGTPTTTPALGFVLSTAGAHFFLGNNTGSTAAPAYVQPAFSDLAGSLSAAQFPALTGDVTTTAGSTATTIGAGKVTYAKLQAASASSLLLGSPSTGTALGEITLGTNLSMSGTTLNATGGGGGTPSAPVNSVQYNSAGVFGGNANFTYNGTTLIAPAGTSATAVGVGVGAANLGLRSGGGYLIFEDGGDIAIASGSNPTGLQVSSGYSYGWPASGLGGANDTALNRNAAGVVEINNGTAGTYADMKFRNLTLTGTCTGCGGGGGTITLTGDVTGSGTTSIATTNVSAKDGTFTLQNTADTTKQAKFDLSNIATATTRTVNIPNANSTTAQPKVSSAGQFINSMDGQGNFGTSGVAAGGNTQIQYNNSGVLGGITNVTTDGTNITISGDPVGVQFYKVASGVNLMATGTTLLYTPPTGKKCLAQGFFIVITAIAGTPTSPFAAVKLQNGAAGGMVPPYTMTATTEVANNVSWVTSTATPLFAATNASPVYVNVTAAAAGVTTLTADIVAEMMIY